MFNHLFDPKDIPEDLRDCFEEVETSCGAPWARVNGRDCEACGAHVPTQAKACQGCGHVRDWKEGRSTNEAMRAVDWSTPGHGTPRLPGGFVNGTHSTGWRPSCACAADEPIPCTVLDPFGGSGTTGVVADELGRDAILCELSPDYAAMAERRVVKARARRLLGPDVPRPDVLPGQLDLLATPHP